MDVIIRDITDNDVEAISAMTAESTLGELYFESDASAVAAAMKSGTRGNQVLIAELEGVPVGFIWFDLSGVFRIHPYVNLQFVRRDLRGRGFGRLLMEAFESRAREVSEKAFLAVAEFNFRAAAFYEALGYKGVGSVPGLYRDGVTENLYVKQIGHM